MPSLRAPAKSEALRARRFDVLVLGGALPGLVAAGRLARDGLRVLVVEEESPARALPGWREPFLLFGRRGGVLDACLGALGLPPLERRGLVREAVAYQMIFPEARVNVGDVASTVEELVSWGVCKPDVAQDTLRVLVHAAEAERAAMLDAAVVRTGRLRGLSRAGVRARRERGLPSEAAHPPPELRPLLDAQVRALSQLAAAAPPPEARARLLGAGFEGDVVAAAPGASLRGLLRRRLESVHVDFAAITRGFDLVEVGGSPGIAVDLSREVWVGRALVLNAPRAALAEVMASGDHAVPDLLAVPRPTHRRVTVAMRARNRVIPEAMERRLVCSDPGRAAEDHNVITLQRFPGRSGDQQDLLGAAVVPDEPQAVARAQAAIEAAVAGLMPFSDQRLGRLALEPPRWDDDHLLSDPRTGHGWPSDADIRLSSRPPVYVLAREEVGALGTEGELLLGWRAGEAIRAQL